MKKLIPCTRCSSCAIEQPPGFTSEAIMRCTERDCAPVSVDDGCTMGVEGPNSIYIRDITACIAGHEAVNGYHE